MAREIVQAFIFTLVLALNSVHVFALLSDQI